MGDRDNTPISNTENIQIEKRRLSVKERASFLNQNSINIDDNKTKNRQEEKEKEILNENNSEENHKSQTEPQEENESKLKLDTKSLDVKIKELNDLINKYSKNEAAQIIIKKKLIISKSAISALNLIKPKEENEHIKKATSDRQSDILRLILLFLNEDFSNLEQEKISEYFLENIFKKYKVENMSK